MPPNGDGASLYQVPPGYDVAAGLPPVALPGSSDEPKRLTIDIRKPAPKADADPWSAAGFSKTPPKAAPAAAAPAAPPSAALPPGTAGPWSAAGFSATPPPPPARVMGTGEAATRGALDVATFGLGPALEALTAAGRAGRTPEQQEAIMPAGIASEAPGMEMMGAGIERLISGDEEANRAYEEIRTHALEQQRLAREQHPWAYMGGELAGAALTPGFGAGAPGTLGARLTTGAIAGGVGGALQGAGGAISEAAPAGEVLQRAAAGAALGAPTGVVLKGVVGPRPAQVITPGERAAATAAQLGAPLPRGVASDSRVVQATTAKMQSLPVVGERIRGKVEAAEEAAGRFVEGTAAELAGGQPSRAVADTLIRPALRDVIDTNLTRIDVAYSNVRSMIDQNARLPMPRTQATLNAIVRERVNAGWVNPDQGLEQFFNVANGTTFNGAQRARVDARAAGDVLVPHPGYNAADFNRLTRAMTADLRHNVQRFAAVNLRSPQRALRAFDDAERQFGALADQNKILYRLTGAPGESAISRLLGAAREKGGNVRLLGQLRTSMPRQDFYQVSGLLLHELGAAPATGDFSLARFVTNWNNISDHAKRVLFDPPHRQAIDDIANLGTHIKGALKQANVSHTAGALIMIELAAHAAALAGDIVSGGGMTTAAAMSAVGHAGTGLLAFWLGNAAKASSIAAFMRAHRAAQLNPTPARVAAFKLATRNMANNLGLDPVKVAWQIESSIAGTTQTGDTDVRQQEQR
jgi:hypothetical protein